MTGKLSGVLGVVVYVFAGMLAPSSAVAQPFPSKPVRFVVPYPAGGPLDEVARAAAQRLAPIWGQQVIVDNRSGAGGSIGADVVAKSVPDGYTMLLGNSGPITVNPNLRSDLQFDLDGWMGVFVRAGTPPEIIAKMHKDIATAVEHKDYRERFAKRGAEVVVGGPEGLAKIIRSEMVIYGNIIKAANIKPE